MIRLASPDIREADIQAAVKVIESGNLVQGANVAAFEKKLVEFSAIPHATVVSSGTAALHLALVALGIGSGDKVVVPAFTFPATANAVESIGGQVVLCDVCPKTYVVTPEALSATIAANPDVKAVMVVHEFGCPAPATCCHRC